MILNHIFSLKKNKINKTYINIKLGKENLELSIAIKI